MVDMTKIKGAARNLYLTDDDVKMVQAISEAVDLPQVQVLTRILHAGLVAVQKNGNRLSLPLEFQLVSPVKIEAYSRAEERHDKPAVRK